MTELQRTYDRIIGPIEDQMIRSIWRIVRNEHDAEDAMQVVLMTVWNRWERVCRHPNPQALVLKFCIDAAYDVTRQRYRHQRRVELLTNTQPQANQSPTPLEAAVYSEQHQEMLAAIHRMPRQQATATLMRIVHGQSYGDIAEVLGCAEVTARKYVARGRSQLQALFSRLNQSGANSSTSS
jgi:RNA polymerase sigma-70 factor (ECF subfamily)